MLCPRCSHPLPPRADRCLRCAPVSLSIESDPPAAPVAFSFDDERAPAPAAAVTEPDPARAPSGFGGWARVSCAVAVLAIGSTAGCAAAAVKIGQVQYPLDFLRDTSSLWLALAGVMTLAWSAFFAAVD